MHASDIDAAVSALVDARRTRRLLPGLPANARPSTVDDAHAIQQATVVALHDDVAGWKVLSSIDGQVTRGVLLRSRVFTSPATIDAADVPMLGVEAEIAFSFERALPPREHDYSYEDVRRSVTAFAAIEVVDSRFADYKGTGALDRLADCGSNGAFVRGATLPEWRALDLVTIDVSLSIDGTVIVERRGGHASKDPLLPAVALTNALRTSTGVPRGAVMTTGTYTGLNYARPGQTVIAAFGGFAPVVVRFGA